ncbi:ferritin-like domain-containing protein [Rhodobacter capsulatus]|uniref:ferritin-like domain-containing protein n=1 Tax=Rhodobacter capsulatus TaxID=1061 RepID=UPI004024F9C1
MTRASGLQAALIEAIEDEYRARASYAAVLARFGPVQPFATIVQAEGRHVAALAGLLRQHGFAVPPDRFAGRIAAPESLIAACEGGVAAEIANAAMYDRLSRTVKDPAALLIFARLRAASALNHLPAFRACLARAGSGGRIGAAPRPAASPASGASPLVWAIGLAAAAVLVRALPRKSG